MANLQRRFLLVVGVVALLAVGPLDAATDYPKKPITIVVPFPPGGTSDIVARLLANGLREKLGQPVLIDNRGGAGTQIGTSLVAKSAPDGYTLLWMATPFAINVSLYKRLPYDTLKDFAPVIDAVSGPLVMIVHPSSPAKTLADLIQMAKKAPDKLTYGSSGNGGSPHLATEMFRSMAGITLTHVPYKGSAPAVTDLIGGQTDLVIDTLFLTTPHVQAGRARALAQTGKVRSKVLPDVPTMSEAGLTGYEATSWMSLAAPAGTPLDVIGRVNTAANAVLQSPEVRDSLAKQGLQTLGGTPQDSLAHLKAEIDRWGQAVRDSGARAD